MPHLYNSPRSFCSEFGRVFEVLLLENISGVAASQLRKGVRGHVAEGCAGRARADRERRGASILGVRSKTRITAAVLDAARSWCRGGFCIGWTRSTGRRERAMHCGVQRSALEQPVGAELALGKLSCCCGGRLSPVRSCTAESGINRRRARTRCADRRWDCGIRQDWIAGIDLAERWACGVFHDVAHVLGGAMPAGELPGVAGNFGRDHLACRWKTQNQDLFSEDEFAP